MVYYREDLSFTKLYKDDTLKFEKVDPIFFSSTPTIPNKEKADLIKAYSQYFDNGMLEKSFAVRIVEFFANFSLLIFSKSACY